MLSTSRRARAVTFAMTALTVPASLAGGPSNKGVDATWATDNIKAGEQQGAYVKAALGSTTPILAMLDLRPGVSVGDQRHAGFLKGMGLTDNSPEIAGVQDTNGDQGQGQTAM